MLNLSTYIKNDRNIDLERFKDIAIFEKISDLDAFSQQIFTNLQKLSSKEYTTGSFTDEQKDTIMIFYGYYKALSMHLKIHSIPEHKKSSHNAAIETQKLLKELSQNGINHISFNLKGTKALQITDKLTLKYILEAIRPILEDRAQAPKGGSKRSYAKEYCQQLKPFFNYLITETYLGKNDKIDVAYWILKLVGFDWTNDQYELWDYLRGSNIRVLLIQNL